MTDDGQATRMERDSMGDMAVPADALYGASTQRAVLNFPISRERMPRRFLRALALIKLAAAQTNAELGRRDPDVASAIGDALSVAPDQRSAVVARTDALEVDLMYLPPVAAGEP